MTQNDDLVVSRFETGWDPGTSYLARFVKNCDPVASSALQLRLLRRDLRLRLLHGQVPQAIDYEQCFPHFAADFKKIIASEYADLVSEEVPVESQFGTLPRKIGKYEVLYEVARDGVSVQYEAIQAPLIRKVCMRALLFPTPETLSKAALVAKIEHPNFENFIDIFKSKSVWLVVSQKEKGPTIDELLRDRPDTIGDLQCVRWIRETAEALIELHRRDIAHLNVCPHKIHVRRNGEAVLVGPEYSRALESVSSGATMEFNEQLPFPYRCVQGNLSSTNPARDDTIAVGVLFFQLLTRRTLESFYLSPPLPGEAKRLKTLIGDQLNYSSEIDPKLKSLCKRLTIGFMEDTNPCTLRELRKELYQWERSRIVSFLKKPEPGAQASRKRHSPTNALARFFGL